MAAISTLPAGQQIPLAVFTASQMNDGPMTPSGDYAVMKPYWDMAKDLLIGQDAIMAAGGKYLPRHPDEEPNDYTYRLGNGVLTNIYADIIETLAAKPFGKELQLADGSAGPEFIGHDAIVDEQGADHSRKTGGLIENIDGKGSHLHVFAQTVFYNGINAAIDWIFIDYPKAGLGLTRQQEQEANIRPYWYRIPADAILEVESAMIGGKEEFIYMRIAEFATVRDGWRMEEKKRVREIIRVKTSRPGEPDDYDIPRWALWERDDTQTDPKQAWKIIDRGVYSIGVIPIVPFICGKRRGTSWVIEPPMKSAAHLQVELYQQETGLKNISNLVCYPMLSASGVNLVGADGKKVKITVGPHTILNAPPDGNGGNPGKWEFIEPNAQSLEFLAKRIETTKTELRDLGRQPLTAQSQNLTVVATAFASQKANSAIMSWTIMLKDALENALAITAMWLKIAEEPEIVIDTDFALDLDGKDMPDLQAMRENGDLSQETLWHEAKRRGKLSPDFTPEEEVKRLKDELPGDGTTTDEIAALGNTAPTNTQTPSPNQ